MRQHVEFDVEVGDREWSGGSDAPVRSMNRVASLKGYDLWIPADAVITDLPDPLQVNDVVSADVARLGQMPLRTVVIDNDGDAWQRNSDEQWRMAGHGSDGGRNDRDLLTLFGPLTVVHIPDA